MTTTTTKDEALTVLKSLQELFQGKPFFKKAELQTDDHGWMVGIWLNTTAMREAGEKVPGDVGSVKVAVFKM